MIGFLLTEDCNLHCKYCYEDGNHNKNTIKFENAKIFIDSLFNNKDMISYLIEIKKRLEFNNIILDFLGGEVLLHYELIDKIIEYFVFKLNTEGAPNYNNTSFRINMCTNGTLLKNEEIKKFLLKWKNVLCLGISIDGVEELHNFNRIDANNKGTWIDAVNSYKWISNNVSAFSMKSTLNKQSINYIYPSIKFFYEELHIKEINQNFVGEPMDLTEQDYDNINRQLELCTNYCLTNKDIIYSMFFNRPSIIHENSGCGIGNSIYLSPDNNFYPCVRCTNVSQNNDQEFSLGHIVGSTIQLNFEKIDKLQNYKIKTYDEECLSCDVGSNCQICIGRHYKETKSYKVDKTNCRIMKIQKKWSDYYSEHK
jgi:uncharacterized protein